MGVNVRYVVVFITVIALSTLVIETYRGGNNTQFTTTNFNVHAMPQVKVSNRNKVHHHLLHTTLPPHLQYKMNHKNVPDCAQAGADPARCPEQRAGSAPSPAQSNQFIVDLTGVVQPSTPGPPAGSAIRSSSVDAKKPIQIIIYAKMRTGSTFTSLFFKKHPDVFYSYEPLQIFPDSRLNHTLHWIDDITLCKLKNFWDTALASPKASKVALTVWKKSILCYKYDKSEECVNKTIDALERNCSSYLAVTAKVIRVTSLVKLLPMMEAGVKVVHLTRDPRAVASSRIRTHMGNIKGQVVSRHVEKHFNSYKLEMIKYCKELRDDLYTVHDLNRNAPPSVKNSHVLVRYEDLALDPFTEMNRMYKIAGIRRSSVVDDWVSEFTDWAEGKGDFEENKKEMVYNTFRKNSTETAMRWRDQIPFTLVETIQHYCYDVMQQLGYPLIDSEQDLTNRSISVLEPLTVHLHS